MNLNSFYTSYKNLKQSLRLKLEEFNIPVNSSMGLTTLINKVRDIVKPNEVTKTVSIYWNDDSNSKGIRPSQIKVNLIDNNKILDSIILSSENSWQGSFSNAPSTASVDVDNVPDGYVRTISGSGNQRTLTLTNFLGNLRIEMELSIDGYGLPESDPEYDIDSDVANLQFKIVGPDSIFPVTITYSQFTDGGYTFDNIVPGNYAVVVVNAESNFEAFLQDDSIIVLNSVVNTDGTTILKSFLHYSGVYSDEVPPEEEDIYIDVPVTVIWNDNDNNDSNRPSSITVSLYQWGAFVMSQVISSANGWSYTFTELPKYDDGGNAIRYSISCDPIDGYITSITGFTIRNDYAPNTVSRSVRKIWVDDDDALGYRPSGISMTLYRNGTAHQSVILNEGNNWVVVIENLPQYVNRQLATYTWTEPTIPYYEKTGETTEGILTTFTNAVYSGPTPPKTPREEPIFDDYDEPL